MGMRGELLVVDDEPAMCEFVGQMLRTDGYAVTCRTRAEDALALLSAKPFDVLLTDMKLLGMNGLELCEKVRAAKPQLPVLLFTGYGDMNAAIAALRAGAADFIPKPNDPDELHRALRMAVGRAMEHQLLGEEVQRLRRKVSKLLQATPLVGFSSGLRKIHNLTDRGLTTGSSLLIKGEAGTGKELVAQIIHGKSSHAESPFVTLNCGSLPIGLLEDNVLDPRAGGNGLVASASGGTLFLKEIDRLPVSLQVMLLRTLENARSSMRSTSDSIRVIATTGKDLAAETAAKRFLHELHAMFEASIIELPPLRERGSDVIILWNHFAERLHKSGAAHAPDLTAAAQAALLHYDWPGNVAELKDVVEHVISNTHSGLVDLENLPESIRTFWADKSGTRPQSSEELQSLEDVERHHIGLVLKTLGGNKRAAARTLKVDRSTLYRKLARYKLDD